MKYKDITYVLRDEAIVPYNMGTVAIHLYDNNESYKKYAFSSPEVNAAVELCKGHSLDDEVEDIVADLAIPAGFYKRYIRYFIVYVEEDVEIACYPRIKYGHCRYWINGKLAFIGNSEDNNPIFIYKYNLKKGKNIFCIELCSIGVPFIKIDIANRDAESTCALADNNFWFTPSEFIVNYKQQSIKDTGIFEFNLLPLDLTLVDYDSKVLLSIENFENKKILLEKEVNFKDVFALDLSFIPNMSEDEFNHLTAVFKATGKDSCIYEKRVSVYRHHPKAEYQAKLLQKAEGILREKQLPEQIINKANCLLHKLVLEDEEPYYGESLKQLIQSIDKGIYCDSKPGFNEHYVFYYSKEDRNCYYYYIFLPDHYDPNKKYPLLLTLSHGHIGYHAEYQNSRSYSHRFSRRNGEAIYADIGGRGCTTGSYMGETFILNEIKHILSHFSVDRNRIYGVGHCAGNMSLFNIAQTHPHLFAGIYARSSTPYMKNVKNLYNVPCYYYVSSYKYDAFLPVKKKLKRALPKLNVIWAQDVYWHDLDMLRSQYTTAAINKLMSEKREEYPNEIYFRTEFNRTNRAYYIQIESIQKGKSFAAFSSKIIEGNIYIHTQNCTGLRIDIPPQINKQEFSLEINGKQFSFTKYKPDSIILRHTKKHGFVLTGEANTRVCSYKGTGILDVYFDPVCVIRCDPLNQAIAKTANAFAHPTSNAAYTYIYVDYPIKKLDNLPDEKENALIIIDNNCHPSQELQFLRTKLPIQMYSDGYVYNGQKRAGKYCIMQVISNPWQANTSVLYVNTNCAELFGQSLFTRKVVISSYISGMHPYLNSVALMFDGHVYYTVKEWGDPLTAVQ